MQRNPHGKRMCLFSVSVSLLWVYYSIVAYARGARCYEIAPLACGFLYAAPYSSVGAAAAAAMTMMMTMLMMTRRSRSRAVVFALLGGGWCSCAWMVSTEHERMLN